MDLDPSGRFIMPIGRRREENFKYLFVALCQKLLEEHPDFQAVVDLSQGAILEWPSEEELHAIAVHIDAHGRVPVENRENDLFSLEARELNNRRGRTLSLLRKVDSFQRYRRETAAK